MACARLKGRWCSGMRTVVPPPDCCHTVDPVQDCCDPTVNPRSCGQSTAIAPWDNSHLGVISAASLRVDERTSWVSLTRVLSGYQDKSVCCCYWILDIPSQRRQRRSCCLLSGPAGRECQWCTESCSVSSPPPGAGGQRRAPSWPAGPTQSPPPPAARIPVRWRAGRLVLSSHRMTRMGFGWGQRQSYWIFNRCKIRVLCFRLSFFHCIAAEKYGIMMTW